MTTRLLLLDLDETLVPTEFLRAARHGRRAVELTQVPGFDTLVPYDGVIDMLAHVAQLVPVGLVTSSPRWYVEQITRLLLDGFEFSTIVTFEDVVRLKLAPDALMVALSRLRTKASDALYVGDHLADSAAATLAGIPFLGAAWADDPSYDQTAIGLATPGDIANYLHLEDP